MLPESRNTTYGSESPVLSADLDDIQDCIIDGKHGVLTVILDNTRLVPWGSGPSRVIGAGGQVTVTTSSAGWNLNIIPELPKGTRVLTCRVWIKDVTGQPAVSLAVDALSNTTAPPGTQSFGTASPPNSAANGTVQTLTVSGINVVIGTGSFPDGVVIGVSAGVGSGAYTVAKIELDIDHP